MSHAAKPAVAVLVLNRDGAHFLDDCFQSLLRNVYPPFDLYLIDNCSQDSSVSLTRTKYPTVRIMQNERNLGFAEAYDRAIRDLDYEYVVLLNNDTIVDDSWLRALFETAEADSRIAACGSKILMARDNTTIDHAGGMLTIIGSGLDRGKWTHDTGQYQEPMEVGFGCGCSLLIRRSAYLEVDGFNPDYIIYHEDVDLCWKMRLFGYSVMYVPESIVYHHLGGGVIQAVEHPFKTYLCQKNRLANMLVNTGTMRLPLALVVSTVYDVVRTARFILMRRGDLLRMLFKGYLDTVRKSADLMRRRSDVQRRRSVSDKACRRYFAPLIRSALEYRRIVKTEAPK